MVPFVVLWHWSVTFSVHPQGYLVHVPHTAPKALETTQLLQQGPKVRMSAYTALKDACSPALLWLQQRAAAALRADPPRPRHGPAAGGARGGRAAGPGEAPVLPGGGLRGALPAAAAAAGAAAERDTPARQVWALSAGARAACCRAVGCRAALL